jgi:5'-nucleotidase
MNILLVNDDGVMAPGIRILKKTLDSIANVYIVSPLEERSTTGHTLTLDHTLRMSEIENNVYGCNGFPADCTLMGVGYLFKQKLINQKIDLVISGINRGANLGQDVFYSGTVAAAREAVFHSIPAISISSCIDFKTSDKSDLYYYTASNFVKLLIQSNVIHAIPSMTMWNINVPWKQNEDIKGVKITKVGFRNYSEEIAERTDFRGRNYYWIGGIYRGFEELEDSDCMAIHEDYISISPMKVNEYGVSHQTLMTDAHDFIKKLTV